MKKTPFITRPVDYSTLILLEKKIYCLHCKGI